MQQDLRPHGLCNFFAVSLLGPGRRTFAEHVDHEEVTFDIYLHKSILTTPSSFPPHVSQIRFS